VLYQDISYTPKMRSQEAIDAWCGV
jgi:hypothetical protein